MESKDTDCLQQLDNLLAVGEQSWLFGAGISVAANIPLMEPLTARVLATAKADPECTNTLELIKGELPQHCHIEHILSQLADHATIAERSEAKAVVIGGVSFDLLTLQRIHTKCLKWIADTIRWGYRPSANGTPEKIGTRDEPIVSVQGHEAFMCALLNRNQAGIAERRRAIRLFTINYDTLLEDALALNCFPYWDGFSGGAIAYRSHRYGDPEPPSGYRAHVIKLHGSIDWHLGTDDRVRRIRDGDPYPDGSSRVIIHPQSSKYLATQRDPFAAQFELFRRAMDSGSENVLGVCGYAFGDEHINQEIELMLRRPENKTTILAFAQHETNVPRVWRRAPWTKRLYVISEDGLHVGPDGPLFPPSVDKKHDWWTFSGVTKILNSGAEACIL